MSTSATRAIHRVLNRGMYSRYGLVRKGTAALLQSLKQVVHGGAAHAEFLARPPVLTNSFPKSGTHLLDQVVSGLPGRRNYGGFLASLTSSFRMRPRSDRSVVRCIQRTAPGESVRAHLFFKPEYADELRALNFVHFFIYRDPRDVIVSSCHYLRDINRWHRWRRHFQQCPTLEDAVLLSIRGAKDAAGNELVPGIAERFAPYAPWIEHPDVCAVRFETLRGDGAPAVIDRMLDYYVQRTTTPLDRSVTLPRIQAAMVPEKSHTFRKGKGGGWREAFTPACRDAFKEATGDMLQRLGYEQDNNW